MLVGLLLDVIESVCVIAQKDFSDPGKAWAIGRSKLHTPSMRMSAVRRGSNAIPVLEVSWFNVLKNSKLPLDVATVVTSQEERLHGLVEEVLVLVKEDHVGDDNVV